MSFVARNLSSLSERQIPKENVLSLLPFSGTQGGTTFTDARSLTWTRSGNAITNTSNYVFGPSSGYFDGNGDYITSNTSSLLRYVLTQSFTFMGWIYPTASNSTGTHIFSIGGGTVAWNSTTGIQCLVQLDSNTQLQFQLPNSSLNGSVSYTNTTSLSLNSWHHIVCQVDTNSNLVGVGVDGNIQYFTLQTRGAPSATPTATYATIPGEAGSSTYAFQGYMDDMSLTILLAKYTGTSYIVPTTPCFNLLV